MIKKRNAYLSLFVVLSILFITTSCSNDNIFIPDVSDIEVDISTVRTEQVIQELDTTNIVTAIQALQNGPDSTFYSLYFEYILRLNVNQLKAEEQERYMLGFLKDDGINRILYEVDSVYQDFVPQEKAFEKAFQYLKYYFPEKATPRVYTYISEYSYQKFVFEPELGIDGLAIGLDMYLGADYPYRKYVGNNENFSAYLTRRYDRDHLVSSVISALVEDMLGNAAPGENLLEKMIYHGKKLYILDKLLPNTPDHILMQYTEEQWEWVQNNEQEMWAFLFKEELFYSTDINKINKLVNPSPSSSGMPSESPGRTANYLGWQIAKAFMKRHPDMSLEELINFEDSQEILEKSKFKPKRN
jgi:hypothetical protein